MLIDVILDRSDSPCEYDPHAFYVEAMEYQAFFPDVMEPISRAMDSGTETDVKLALVRYVIEGYYNPDIAAFICSVDWLKPESLEESKARRERERIMRMWRSGEMDWGTARKLLEEMAQVKKPKG